MKQLSHENRRTGTAFASVPVLMLVLAYSVPAGAQDLSMALASSRLTGDWGGARTAAEHAGFTFDGSYTYDFSTVLSGGREDGSVGRWLLDVGAELDLEAIAGLRGATAFAGFFAHRGPDGSTYAGDIQAYSNIDAEHFDRMAEVWYEQRFKADRVRVKLGRVDANSEFAAVEAAGDFLNASAGFSPTIFGLPTYPEPAMSANVFVRPTEWLVVGAGLYDGPSSDGVFGGIGSGDLFWVHEVGLSWGSGNVGVGGWRLSGTLEDFDGASIDGSTGWFAHMEQSFGPEGDDAPSGINGAVFVQYGVADEAVSEVTRHIGIGLVVNGLLLRDRRDGAGLMVTAVGLNRHPALTFREDEVAVEGYYRLPVTDFLSVTGDLQYIVRPSGGQEVGHAFVGTLRVRMTL